ncbi:TIGR02391 family protein [Cellulomonas sp. McL0617]|uniref:TIGR02391 family protein n=1 Tax=Cellulomonas sp. McL0617 TaxID=3415675 RepID=UPI003CECA754
MANWTLEADEVVSLPLDELALRVLTDYRDNNEWNWRNWMLLAMQEAYPRRPDAVRALAEAWSWILNHGLVAPNLDKGDHAVVVSRQGEAFLDRGAAWLRSVERLDVELVPALERTARPQFLRGDFETAAFVAMKEVEVQLRAISGLGHDLVGVKLAQEAFRQGGPLHREETQAGEAVAIMDLFKGAIGLFKNPASHRRVDLSDATEAAEIVLLADLLMRLLKRLEVEAQGEDG